MGRITVLLTDVQEDLYRRIEDKLRQVNICNSRLKDGRYRTDYLIQKRNNLNVEINVLSKLLLDYQD